MPRSTTVGVYFTRSKALMREVLEAAHDLHASILKARHAVKMKEHRRPTHVRIHPGDLLIIETAARELGVEPGTRLWSLDVEVDPSVDDPVVEAR